MATTVPTDNAIGFKVIQDPTTGGYSKSYVNSAGTPVADQAGAPAQLYPNNPNVTPAPTTGGSSAPANNYAVVTSQPATDNHNAIVNTYNNQIKPAIDSTTTTNTANQNIPTTAGYYPYTTQKTGQAGEISTQINGQTYYASPEKPPAPAATASDVITALNGGGTGTTGTTGTGTNPTPADTATQQTGVDPKTLLQNETNTANQAVSDLIAHSNQYQQMTQNLIAQNDAATQSIINNTNTLFQQMITQAQTQATMRSSQFGDVSNQVTGALGDITNIQATQAVAVGKLQQGMIQQDYQMTTDAYKDYVDTQSKITTTLQDLNDKMMTAYNTALDAAQKQQAADYQKQKDAQDEADRQTQLKETALKDQADIQHQKDSDAIAAADLAIKQGTFNATYGIFMNSDGTQNTSVTPQQIPGYTQMSTGASYINGANLPSGLTNKPSIGGIPVVPAVDKPVVDQYGTTMGLLNKVQSEYNAIKAGNPNNPNGNTPGAPNPAQQQFNQDVVALNNNLASLSKNAQFSSLSTFKIESPGSMFDKGASNFNSIRDQLNTSVSNLIPGFQTPVFGQTFSSVGEAQSWADQNGYGTELSNLQKSYPNATASQLLEAINTGQEPK